MVSALAEAMGGEGGEASPAPASRSSQLPATVKPKALLSMMGVSID